MEHFDFQEDSVAVELILIDFQNIWPLVTEENYLLILVQLVAYHGLEAERHLLRCLFSHVDFSGDGKSSGKDFHQTQLLIQECASILNRPNFVSTFCYAIDCPLQQQKSLQPSSLFSQLSKVLKLSSVQEIAFGLALLHSSNPELTNHAVNILKQKLPDFIKHICDQDSSQENSLYLPPVIAHLLLHQLNCGTKDFGIPSDIKRKLSKRLKKGNLHFVTSYHVEQKRYVFFVARREGRATNSRLGRHEASPGGTEDPS
ncbi:CCR4-NOT transcription complex subunit 1 [Trichonephila clavipes]|uniref:CCR4-NOT transcription complex subunit 1 n=1 Tax=Trichonephila clavipes TaxID=2585209 RepID=A0A8X6W4T5_TRICX|nr:CCR4-NOT transcription complex subunit 1 [Trichonephila clavipes]